MFSICEQKDNEEETMLEGIKEGTFWSQMLDLETVSRPIGSSMAVDFATYLLSTSPPATNLELLSYAFSPQAARNWSQGMVNSEEENGERSSESLIDNMDKLSLKKNRRKAIKPIIIRKEELNSDGEHSDVSSQNSGTLTPTSPTSPGRIGKKVSFADHKGLALATVKFMTEPSDQPPKFEKDLINKITCGAKAEVTGLPPYRLKFTQPASDYMAFRDRIEKNCVSLENVILRDYNVLGTIKVKNLSFDKRVFIRCTYDNWASSQDVEARFVNPSGPSNGNNIDTFSFEFEIPTQTDTKKDVEFAVCFECSSSQYWDNNLGSNYHITATDFNTVTHHINGLDMSTQPSLEQVSSWSEYSCWHHVDTSSPYY